MNAADRECPSTSVLESIAYGTPTSAETEEHISRCPRCCEYLGLARFSHRFGAVLAGEPTPVSQPEGSPRIHGYRVIAEIARGGQGVVYRAEQSLTGKSVAIKVLHSVSDETARARLHREMQIIASLDHPSIVRLIDCVRIADGREAVVMEHILGDPITRWAERDAPDISVRLRVLAEVADALQHAHKHGVVHRDLTPSNILIDHLGRPHLLDFGIARLITGRVAECMLTRTGEFTGTLAYSSPEQVSGESGPADARSDVYSLGVIGYRILTGDMPYAVAGPLEEVIRSITSQELPSRSRSRLGADPWTVLHQAMQKDPSRRYKDAASFSQDLRRAAEGQAINARASSPAYRLSVTLRRHRKLFAASILLMAASIAIVTVSNDRVDRTDRARARSELATLLATGSRARAESLLWQELDRVAPTTADPLDLMWNADLDTRSLVWAFAEMQSEALCLASDRAFQTPPLSIIALDSGDFGVIAADRTVYLARSEGHGISFEKGPRLDPAIRYARFVPDRDWIIAITASGLHVLDSKSGESIASREMDDPPQVDGLAAQSETLVLCRAAGTLDVFSLPYLQKLTALPGIAGGQNAWIDPSAPTIWFLDQHGVLCSHHLLDAHTTPHGLRVPVHRNHYAAEVQIIPARRMAVIAHAGKVFAAETDGPASASPVVLHSGYRMNLRLNTASRVLIGQSIGDSALRLWDTTTWLPAGELSGHSGSLLFTAISKDGSRCLTGDSIGTIRLWALPGADWRTDLSEDTDSVHDFSIAPDGTRAFLPAGPNGVRSIRLSNPRSQSDLKKTDFHTTRTAVHPRGHMLAAADSGGRIWISGLDGLASSIDVIVHLEPTEAIVAAHFAPSADLLYVATQDGELIEIDAVNGRIKRRVSVARDGRVSDFAISPDGSAMAVCTRGGVLVLIDAKTLSVRRTEQVTEKQIRSVCFHPSGRTVACVGDSGSVLMYDLHTNRAKTSELISTASLFDVAMHPGGHTLAIGNRHGTVYLVDSATLKPLCKLGGTGSVMALAFTPEGDRLVVSRLEQPPQIWDLTQLVRPLTAVRPTRNRSVRAMKHSPTQSSASTAWE